MIKILFLAANPSDTDPLQLAEEVRAIDIALRRGQYRDLFDLKSHWAVRSSDVQELLLRHRPDIVHFSGHGSSQGAIILEDEFGRAIETSPHYLRALFRAMAGKTRCVVLNACFSEIQAAALVGEVGILIGMTDAVQDMAARAFSAAFYQALAYGQDVQTAYELGREQIMMDISPAADVLRLIHAQNVSPGDVKFAQLSEPSAALTQSPPPGGQAPPSNGDDTKIGPRWEILIPALVAILVALIGILPPILDRIWPTSTAVVTVAPSPTEAVTTSGSTVTTAITPTPLFADTGFNVAVAAFLEGTATGQFTTTATSAAIGEWLFAAVNNEASRLPPTLRSSVLGPKDVPSVEGLTADERARFGQGFADRNNITLLIYGVVSRGADGYVVAPEFYVGENSFSYGSEIVGSNRLGQPVPFQLPITSATLATVNRALNSRTQVLRHIIEGLAYYSIEDTARARQGFDYALMTPGWEAGEGQEVLYLLIGATALAEYDQIVNRTPLADAKAAFAQAYILKPHYARALLGMGAVLLQEACILNAEGRGCGDIDAGKLQEARQWYETSLSTNDNQPSYFVELKAAFGLGQVELAGGEFAIDEFNLAQATQRFERVIALGEGYSSRTIVSYVGNAYAHLGRIAYLQRDYVKMASHYHRSIQILDELAPYAPLAVIARNWAAIGYAEKQLGNEDRSSHAYCRAMRVGSGLVSEADLKAWSAQCREEH